MSMKKFVGKSMVKSVSFMGEKIEINKLSVNQVMEIQEKSKANKDGDESSSMDMLKYVIGCAVPSTAELTDAEFRGFPIDELSNLSTAILEFSGLGNAVKPAK